MKIIKVKLLSEDKVSITISLKELQERNISLKDLQSNSCKAKNLFLDLIEESDLDNSFLYDQSQLFIEAATDNHNYLTITITKIKDFPDTSKYDLLNTSVKKSNYCDFYIFRFSNLDSLIQVSNLIHDYRFFIGKNTLYQLNGRYYLVFSKYSLKNINFVKSHLVLCEYSEENEDSSFLEIKLKERANVIIKDKALQLLNL